MQPHNKDFSKREWVQTIILLSIIQAFFWYVVFENSQSASALGYVSFAGTLVSIILAVLAIGYTYGESISQKNKSNALAEQITTLGELISNIELEAQSLNKIQEISKELSNFISIYRKDKQSSDSQLDKIKSIMQQMATPIVDVEDEHQFVGPLSKVEKLMHGRTPLDETCYLILVYLEKNHSGNGLYDVGKIIKNILSDIPFNLDMAFFEGACYTQFSILKSLELITGDEDTHFTINNDLKDFIKNNIGNAKDATDNPYNNMVTNLYNLIYKPKA
ncbi:hypothetical protein ACET5Y_11245 [Aeromonas veronii]